ncbi:MAG: hypothetical protein HLUCCO15_14450 [Erythrobacteraceae bacterium HL-111]|nr:MAG: hypothetical protein HLUCCO15_14450 [Erythrobacteraceae bacterium HL-111]
MDSSDDTTAFSKWKAKLWNGLGYFVLFLVLGPYGIALLFGFAGAPFPGGWFAVWLMAVLTFGGVVVTWDLLKSAKHHGLGELGCAIPMALVTCWFGWLLLKELGVMK